MSNLEKVAANFGLQGDHALISLANDIYHGTRSIDFGILSAGRPYASLEMAYLHLGRPSLLDKPLFLSKSGISDSNYQRLIDKLSFCISNEDIRRKMSPDVPLCINSVQSVLKGLGITELEPQITAIHQEFLKKMDILAGECSLIPVAVILSCLALNPKLYGQRSSFLKLDAMANAFLVKKKALQEKISNVEIKCEAALKSLKKDKSFESALAFAFDKLTSKPCTGKLKPAHVPLETDNFEMEIDAGEPSTSQPLAKRKRTSANFTVDILEGYGETWGPLGIVPLLPLQTTREWFQYEQLEQQYQKCQQRLQAGKPHANNV